MPRRTIRPRVLRCVPDHPRLCACQVHRQRGIALLQQACVGHEVGAADNRDGAARIGVSDHRALVALRHRHVAGFLEGVARAELHIARALGFPQIAIRSAARRAARRSTHLRREDLPGPRNGLHHETVAGHRGQPPQHVVVDEVTRLHGQHKRVGPRRAFHRGDVVGDDHVDPVVAKQGDDGVSALGRRCGGIHSAPGPRRRQQSADRGDDADHDDGQRDPAAAPPALAGCRRDRRCGVRHRTDVQLSGGADATDAAALAGPRDRRWPSRSAIMRYAASVPGRSP